MQFYVFVAICDTCDLADGLNDKAGPKHSTIEIDEEDAVDECREDKQCEENNDDGAAVASKTNSLIIDMAKPFFGSGQTMSMDNYYGGAFTRITKKDTKLYTCGSYNVAVYTDEGIQSIGWLDGNPVVDLNSPINNFHHVPHQ
eukprot:14260642-Ditylum_brightwellii.AAC.1